MRYVTWQPWTMPDVAVENSAALLLLLQCQLHMTSSASLIILFCGADVAVCMYVHTFKKIGCAIAAHQLELPAAPHSKGHGDLAHVPSSTCACRTVPPSPKT
jgi:hypothetical protein